MLSNVAFLDFGAPELIIILAIVLLLFGGKKLPELSRSLGDSMRELKKGLGSDNEQKKSQTKTSSSEENNS